MLSTLTTTLKKTTHVALFFLDILYGCVLVLTYAIQEFQHYSSAKQLLSKKKKVLVQIYS